MAPSDTPRRSVDSLEKWGVLLTEVELEAGKIRLLAREISLHGGDCLGYLRRRGAGFGAGQPAQQNARGRFCASSRQLEASDAHIVPSDATKAACGFEDEIMVRPLAHHIALAFGLSWNS